MLNKYFNCRCGEVIYSLEVAIMFKYLTIAYALLLITPTLYADADFCEESKPCGGDEKTYVCPFCSKVYTDYENEVVELQKAISWPGKNDDPFVEALSH